MLAKVQCTEQALGDTVAPDQIAQAIAMRMRGRRKELCLSQSELAQKSGVSLGSLKRFEHDYLISLESLIKLSVALQCEADLAALFVPQPKTPQTLEEMVAQGHQLLDQIVLLEH